MTIWFVLLGIAVLAIALLVVPLWRRSGDGPSRAAFDAQVYRDQLAELQQTTKELDEIRERLVPRRLGAGVVFLRTTFSRKTSTWPPATKKARSR